MINSLYRHIDGTNNNLLHPTYGSAGSQFLRGSPADYGDGYNSLAGSDRSSAREISNTIFDQSDSLPNTYGTSNIMWVWGQFLDHDIDLAREGHTEYTPIEVPTGDPYFDPNHTGLATIPLTRSDFQINATTQVREQVNDITAFIDASNVYGSDAERAEYLRADGGKLKVSDDNLLPYNNAESPFPNAGGESSELFLAGDVRANENVALTSMHTLFVREHNRWVDELSKQHPEYDADTLYQEAKVLVEAQIQSITYNEFLPHLLGPNALENYSGYDNQIDPQIANVFATAAYRLGHTMLSNTITRLEENGEDYIHGDLALRDAFFQPTQLLTEGNIEAIFRGISATQHEAIDTQIIDDVRNFLFGEPGQGGLDLAALNIQRGRDHGLSDYNTVREAYGLAKVSSFSEITSNPELQYKLNELYGNVDNIDVFVGGLAEDTYGQSMLGELFHTILVDQFTRLRDGDSFWYENRLTEEQWDRLENNMSLSEIIRNNMDIDYLQDDVFVAYDRTGGSKKSDVLTGSEHHDLMMGNQGNDKLYGRDNDDVLYGGKGKDKLYGGQDNDALYGESGQDKLYGQAGNDRLYGGEGNDHLYGGQGHDELMGGPGKDQLYGQAGNDFMMASEGTDKMTGGQGYDTFYIGKHTDKTVIKDFKSTVDQIDLSEFHLNQTTLYEQSEQHGKNLHFYLDDDVHVVVQGIHWDGLAQDDIVF